MRNSQYESRNPTSEALGLRSFLITLSYHVELENVQAACDSAHERHSITMNGYPLKIKNDMYCVMSIKFALATSSYFGQERGTAASLGIRCGG